MSYYQNVFPHEFIGNWVLGDRQASLSFRCPANTGRGDEIVQSYGLPNALSGSDPAYNLGGNDLNGNSMVNFSILYARDFPTGFKGWTSLTIVVAGPGATIPTTAASTTPAQIVANLNADPTFATMFVATLGDNKTLPSSVALTSPFTFDLTNDPLADSTGINLTYRNITIRQIIPTTQLRFYIDNHGAETLLRFNAHAGVAQLPSYFDRHTIDNRFNFTDGDNHLIGLTHLISHITKANPGVITSVAHGLVGGNTIAVANANAPLLNTTSAVIHYVSADTFDTVVDNSGGVVGNYGVWARLVDNAIIANAVDKNGNTLGYTLASTQRDYELLQGRSGLFMCQYTTSFDANTPKRPLRTIEFPMGATAGYLGKVYKYDYTNSGTDDIPTIMTVEPYVLTAADISATVPPSTVL